MSTKTSKEYKAIKNYIHNELGLTKEDIINAIRSDIRKYVEECICNTYGNDNNIEQMIKFMVDNELKNKDFNVIPRMVEKVFPWLTSLKAGANLPSIINIRIHFTMTG